MKTGYIFLQSNEWAFHPGELPQRPHIVHPFQGVDSMVKYHEAIKQNALTVWNSEICPQNISAVEPDKFYKWPGGYRIEILNAAPRDEPSEPDEFAILTLPEEKKPTRLGGKVGIRHG